MTTKFDDWSWHAEGDFPADVPPEAGATHVAMFFAWAVVSGITGDDGGLEDMDEIKTLLLERKLMPGSLFLQVRDGKLFDDDFSPDGKLFAATYYQKENLYLTDYETILGADLPTLYHVPDSWSTFDKLRGVLDIRFDEWKRGVLRENSE